MEHFFDAIEPRKIFNEAGEFNENSLEMEENRRGIVLISFGCLRWEEKYFSSFLVNLEEVELEFELVEEFELEEEELFFFDSWSRKRLWNWLSES